MEMKRHMNEKTIIDERHHIISVQIKQKLLQTIVRHFRLVLLRKNNI